MGTKDFDFANFVIGPDTDCSDLSEAVVYRFWQVGVPLVIQQREPTITFELLRESIAKFIQALGAGQELEEAAKSAGGVPPWAAFNMFVLFMMHWDCGQSHCLDCTAQEVVEGRAGFHANFNPATTLVDLEVILQRAKSDDSGLPFLDLEGDYGGAYGENPHYWPSQAGAFDDIFNTVEDMGELAAVIAEGAAQFGITIDKALEETEALAGGPCPEELRNILNQGTYPGGPNEASAASSDPIEALMAQLTALGMAPPADVE